MNRFIGIVLAYLVRLYQWSLGMVLGGRCRFYPSCSEYSHEALIKYGATKGSLKAIRRILRCHPWSPGGIDPA